MASSAQTGMGATLAMNPLTTMATVSGTNLITQSYTTISEVTSIDPSFTVGEADVTHLGSAGLSDFLPTRFSGTVGFGLNFLRGSHVGALAAPVDQQLMAAQYARQICAFKLTFPPTVPTNSTDVESFSFKGFITEFSPSLGIDDGTKANCSIRISDSQIATATT